MQDRPGVVSDLDCHALRKGTHGALIYRIPCHVSEGSGSFFLDSFNVEEFQAFFVEGNGLIVSNVEVVAGHGRDNPEPSRLFLFDGSQSEIDNLHIGAQIRPQSSTEILQVHATIGLARRHTSMSEHELADHEQKELEEQVMRFRMMEREVTDPLATRLLQDIVAEMEANLRQSDE
ncbi:hypothetical protein AAFX91_39185 [Bradyrhizobium sp. 31Argb]|uniref:hypothetical protein n=2 Tax=unclassified Bradyrhizobium TaxID=2631580 RepID=UPI0013EE7F65